MLTETEDITEWIWKIAVDSGSEIRYFDLLHGKASASAGWTEFATFVTLPAWVRGAASIDLYLEAFPETTSFLVDDVALYEEDTSGWEEEANERIEQIRKSDLRVTFVMESGGSVDDLQLEVNQKSHQFGFGSAVQSLEISRCQDGEESSYCTFAKENFNFMSDTYRMKWKEQEPSEGELNEDSLAVVDKLIEWGDAQGMQVRGHSLLWARGQNNPDWVGHLKGQQLAQAMETRVDTAVGMYNGLLPHWDVINEMIGNNFYVDGTGDPEIRASMFKRAKEISPDTLLFVNEYGVLLDKYGRFEGFREVVRDLLAHGAPVDALGLQGHITEEDLADVATIQLHLDQLWEEFKLPIWITEFTFNVAGEISDPDHSIHAEQLENFYRVAFAHQAVQGIVMWQFQVGVVNLQKDYNFGLKRILN